MSADFRVTMHDEARRELWQQWIGTDTVCVRTPLRTRVMLDGHGPADAFILDEQQLSPEQQRALCEGIAARFQANAEEVDQDMRSKGIVILAEHCSVMVVNPGKWVL